jgi:hypothetical protein
MQKYLSLNKYYNFALNQLAKFISPIIRRWELPKIQDYGKKPLQHQPVFIIGAPRTGSTILYQALTNLYDILYIDNLVCRFHRNLFFGFCISNRIYGANPHNTFKSYHGQTRGAHSPSECGQFWYRWLPRDHHFIDYDEITPLMVEKIRREITAIINYFDKPIVFKNLNAGQRLRLLKKAFPGAKFIFIRRDPRFVALSILKGRKKVKAKKGFVWGIMPPNYKMIAKLDELDMCCAQIYYIEEQIIEDLSLFPNKNIKTIHYQELSLSLIAELANWMDLKKRVKFIKPFFRKDEITAGNGIIEIENYLKKYSFDESLFI